MLYCYTAVYRLQEVFELANHYFLCHTKEKKKVNGIHVRLNNAVVTV